MKILRIRFNFIEHISVREILINCTVAYQHVEGITREATVQFRLPELSEDNIIFGIETSLEYFEDAAKVLDTIHACYKG